MSFTGGGRGGAPARAANPGAQRRAVTANVNLFEISLVRMGSMVFQYDGWSFHLFSFTLISSCAQLVSRSLTLIIYAIPSLNIRGFYHPRYQSRD